MKRKPNDGGAEVIQYDNNFDNPVVNEEPMYDTIPEAVNTAAGPIPRVTANDGLREVPFQDDRNAIRIDQSGNRYNLKIENFGDPRNQQYAYRQGRSRGYAHLHRPALQVQGMMGSQNENDMPVREGENYMRPANSHYIVPCDESRASTRRSDNMKLVDGHYKIPPRGRITKENASCDNMMFTDESQV